MKPCPMCDDPGPWPDPQERAAHIRSHHEITCPVCGVTLNAGGLDAHLRYVHPDEPAAGGSSAAPGPEPDAPAPSAGVEVEAPVVGDEPPPAAEPVAEPPTSWTCPDCDASPFSTLKGYKAHVRSHVDVDCPECGKKVKANGLGPHLASHRRAAAHPAPPRPAPPLARDAEVLCDECGRTVKASGLGNHRAGHRRAEERKQRRDETSELPPAPAARPLAVGTPRPAPATGGLAVALAELLPGAAGGLVDRLTEFVDKHKPHAGDGRWLVATLDGKGPWLCRTAGVGLVVAREHVGVVVVSVDDVYAHLRRREAAA